MIDVLILSKDNAGRSQMAKALLVRELMKRGLETEVDVETAGTDPADRVPKPVKEVMAEQDVFLDDSYPSQVSEDQFAEADYLITIGFRPEKLPGAFDGEQVAWNVADPGTDTGALREARDRIHELVEELIDEWQDTNVLGDGYNLGDYDGY